jgi:hypothetical protein
MFELSARRALLSVWLLDPNVLDPDMGWRVAFGSGAALMIAAALVTLKLGIAAECKSLEEVAPPLSSEQRL